MTLLNSTVHSAQPLTAGISDRLQAARENAGNLTRRFWYSMRRFLWHSYWDLEVSGADHVPQRGAVLLCGNHTSHLDAMAILAALPRRTALRTRTAAARDVFGRNPIRNAASRILTNSMPIQRGGKFSGGLRALESVLLGRMPLILFPEGRRSPDGKLVEFKNGAAMLALRTGAPIVPIKLQGVRRSLARGRHIPLPARVRVRFGRPIDPRPYRAKVAAGRISRREAYAQLTGELKSAIAD